APIKAHEDSKRTRTENVIPSRPPERVLLALTIIGGEVGRLTRGRRGWIATDFVDGVFVKSGLTSEPAWALWCAKQLAHVLAQCVAACQCPARDRASGPYARGGGGDETP